MRPRTLFEIARRHSTRRTAWRIHGNYVQLCYGSVVMPPLYAGNSESDGRRVAALWIREAREVARMQ